MSTTNENVTTFTDLVKAQKPGEFKDAVTSALMGRLRDSINTQRDSIAASILGHPMSDGGDE